MQGRLKRVNYSRRPDAPILSWAIAAHLPFLTFACQVR